MADKAENVGRHPRDYKIVAQWLITIVAIALVVVHLSPLSLKIDNTVLALFVISIIPWLGSVFKTVELPGFAKFEYIEKKVDTLNNDVANVKDEVSGAIESSRKFSEATSEAVRLSLAATRAVQADPKKALLELADEYVKTRKRLPRGAERTGEVSRIFGKMTAVACDLKDLDVRNLLESEDEGKRLAAIAFLYANPNPNPHAIDQLIASVTEQEDKAFNQYWGLRTIQKLLGVGGPISVMNLGKLREFSGRLHRGTDRYFEVNRILAEYQSPNERS